MANILMRVGLFRTVQIIVLSFPLITTASDACFDAAVKYAPERNEIVLGEPLYVTFSVTNKGSNSFSLETGGDYRMAVREGRFSFKATDTNGVAANDPFPIKPNHVYSQKLFLPLWVKFDHAGQYRVHAERPLQLYAPSDEHNRALTNSGTFDFDITVLPANPILLGNRIQELSEQTKIPEQASDAAWALAYIEDDRVIPYLLNIVEAHKDKGGLLYPAIEGLGRHPGVNSTQGLIKLLNDPKHIQAAEYEIIEALSKMRSRETEGALRELLNSPDAFTRKTAARFLGQMEGQDSIDALKSRLTDSSSDVRLASARALAQLGAFERGLNSPIILANILDQTNPSVTNSYNEALFRLIAQNGGPNITYNFVFREFMANPAMGEREVLENKKALKAILIWANSTNPVQEN